MSGLCDDVLRTVQQRVSSSLTPTVEWCCESPITQRNARLMKSGDEVRAAVERRKAQEVLEVAVVAGRAASDGVSLDLSGSALTRGEAAKCLVSSWRFVCRRPMATRQPVLMDG
ncbi:hypothetical protein DSL92_04380 [Billgrantia gudaonensis]|uniref:Uncharacterized protein n=1 Tax=Billgrantia gudaonensis TaxID=376427 RepID=A0A3S0VSX6_9GAMM|nr:hypothetical protein DSL92_04380 [Halomonas gudaonensis]